MDSERNRIANVIDYIESLGVQINISKNRARGNKGIFFGGERNYRIDISNKVPSDKVLPTLLHEFAHYIHFQYDKNLNSLDFVFDNLDDEKINELINVTVQDISKDFAKSIYTQKNELKIEIDKIALLLKEQIPDFKLSKKFLNIEKDFKGVNKYFLKYEQFKFNKSIYKIEDVTGIFNQTHILYARLKAKQRLMKNLNARIAKLNKYYNTPTELFARFVQMYYTEPTKVEQLAPVCYKEFTNVIKQERIKELNILKKLL